MRRSYLIGSVLVFFAQLYACTPAVVGKSESNDSDTLDNARELRLPQPPLALATAQSRLDYVALHYWSDFNFRNTTLIGDEGYTEQAFSNFTQILSRTHNPRMALSAMLDSASADSSMFQYFIGLSDKYFDNPNSPLRNEEYSIIVLQYLMTSRMVSKNDKISLSYRLKMLMKNQQGSVARSFCFTTPDSTSWALHQIRSEYLILFFNYPDCEDCARVKEYMSLSPVLSEASPDVRDTARLKILALYPGEVNQEWRSAVYPSFMIKACDPVQSILKKELYELRAFPTLYLLDKEKRVLLKDVSIEAIERWLIEAK